MSQSHAFLMGVPTAEGLPPCPGAREAVQSFGRQIEPLGFARGEQTVLLGSQATLSAARSRLRRIVGSLQPGDTLWVLLVGPAFIEDDLLYFACADTLADDRSATSLSLDEVVRTLDRRDIRVVFWLDCPGWADDELREFFPPQGPHVALLACKEGEDSHVAGKRRLWLHLVGTALEGRAPQAAPAGDLTAGSLQAWLADELPREVRKTLSTADGQTPWLLGPGNMPLARIKPVEPPATARLDPRKLRRLTFRGDRRTSVRNLAGFQKGFDLPQSDTPSSRKWVWRLAQHDLQALVEENFQALRDHLGYKRKDLETTVETEGQALIRTPDFDLTMSVTIDPEDTSRVVWRHEVRQIARGEVLRSDAFRQALGGKLSELEFEFEKPVDVAALVDRIEEEPLPGVSVRVSSDGSRCEITLRGFAGSIQVEPDRLRIDGPPGATPDSLVEQFLAFQTQYGGKRGLPKLRG